MLEYLERYAQSCFYIYALKIYAGLLTEIQEVTGVGVNIFNCNVMIFVVW